MPRYVDNYVCNEKEMKIKANSKNTFHIEFDKILGCKYTTLNTFVISKKKAFCNSADVFAKYINFFINYYDYDNELLLAYYAIQYRIEATADYPIEMFVNDLYDMIMTPTMIDKIRTMSSDEFYFNVTDKEDEEKYKDSHLQFTNDHTLILMNMSTAMKLFIPSLSHYAYVNKVPNVSRFILMCFDGLFDIFQGEVDIYNKIYELVHSIVIATKQSDKLLWSKLEILGITISHTVDNLTRKIFIDIMPKYIFGDNIIKFNYSVIRQDLDRVFSFKFDNNLKELNITKKDAEGLSGFDKIEVNMIKQDEAIFITGNVIAETTIQTLIKRFNIQYTQEDLDFYIENVTVSQFQRDLMFLFFAKYFGSSKILFNINMIGYCQLIIILQDLLSRHKFQYMQFLLSGKVQNNVLLSKKIINKKQIIKLQQSYKFQDIVNNKYKFAYDIIESGEVLYRYIGELMSSNFGLIYHKRTEDFGRRILVDKDELCEEFLKFIEMI